MSHLFYVVKNRLLKKQTIHFMCQKIYFRLQNAYFKWSEKLNKSLAQAS
jgi:hypothetical protein